MTRLLVTLVACCIAAPAHAHIGVGPTHSFAAGLLHPLSGLDHVAAMVAVGLWAGLNGGARIWVWPAAFVATMLAAAILGYAGVGLPYVEPAIAASVIILGLLVASAVKAPTAAGAAIVALFAVAHGHVHGTELGDASAGVYMAGLALATASLHGIGMLLARVGPRGAWLVPARFAGVATAVTGISLLIK